MDLPTLQRRVEAARDAGETIVFTNGCFDLLHVGHLRLLEAARAEGDRLVVALNDDASIARLKGEARPVTPFDERAELLRGLAAVDWVIGFGDDTPLALIEALSPDVLVKGGDWPLDRIVGREHVEARGGRVVQVPLAPGVSTSALIERVRTVELPARNEE